MNRFNQITSEQYKQLVDFMPINLELFKFLYERRVCKVTRLLQEFPKFAQNEDEFLVKLGGVNGKIWKKFNFAIYPIEVNTLIAECAYSIGYYNIRR